MTYFIGFIDHLGLSYQLSVTRRHRLLGDQQFLQFLCGQTYTDRQADRERQRDTRAEWKQY